MKPDFLITYEYYDESDRLWGTWKRMFNSLLKVEEYIKEIMKNNEVRNVEIYEVTHI